ncbi:MAG: glycosyltransferase family 4 protein [Candidatus Doudnabacteria bacterium]|nr:glycosyltransferase family 4 protein [Candidatus Doudnabacteria bacterium]
MTIGIEAERANLPQKTGVEVYAAELIKNLARQDAKNDYVLYFRSQPQDWFQQLPPNFKLKVIPFPKFWTQLRISWEILWHPVDVLAILASALPIWHPANSVVTVHDVAWKLFPEAFTPFMRRYLEWSTSFAVRSASKVIAVSESTKRDLVKYYQINPEKIEVIPLAAGEQFRPQSYEQSQPILDKFGLVYQKYILFVGTMQPRKNIPRLVEAFIRLKQKNHIEEKLVIVGKKGWLWQPIEKKIAEGGLGQAVKVLDYVTDEDLPALFSGASVFTLPALYEGFGIPPLEAMACGVPVVVSNVSSLPEVVGDAGILVDPNSVDSIAEGLLKGLTDKEFKASMVQKGLEQAAKFSWEETARKTLVLLESLKN